MKWIRLAYERVPWRAFLYVAVNIHILWQAAEFHD